MILDSRFWILDCGLKEHESHCPKRLRGERAERTGPPTLWYLGNVNCPQCHANQVVPATGLVDDAMTPHESFEVALPEFRPEGAATCQPRASPWELDRVLRIAMP